MLGASASMCCIIKYIKNNAAQHELLSLAIIELEASIKLTNKYFSTRNSIYWNTSKTALKASTHSKMNILAFNAYTHFLTAIDYLNQYADTREGDTVPKWWLDIMVSLAIADNDFKRSSKNINQVQLELDLCI